MAPHVIKNWIICYFVFGTVFGYFYSLHIHTLLDSVLIEKQLEEHSKILEALIPLFLSDPDFYRPEICDEIYQVYILTLSLETGCSLNSLNKFCLSVGLERFGWEMHFHYPACPSLEEFIESKGLPYELKEHLVYEHYKTYILPKLIRVFITKPYKDSTWKPPY